MDTAFSLFGDSTSMMLTLTVFLATATLTFSVMAFVRVHGAVKRRAAGIRADVGENAGMGSRGLRGSSVKAAQRLVEYATRHYSSADSKDMKALRRRLVLAGIFDPRGVAFFFLGRIALALGLALAMFLFAPVDPGGSAFWFFVSAAGIAGYIAPSIYLARRIAGRRDEHRAGFPDFMDLLVVCADAGLSMEAALDRVGRELSDSYPSLSANIHMANLEIRAGRTLTDALDHLHVRDVFFAVRRLHVFADRAELAEEGVAIDGGRIERVGRNGLQNGGTLVRRSAQGMGFLMLSPNIPRSQL